MFSTYMNMEKLSAGNGFEINKTVFDIVGSEISGSSGGVSTVAANRKVAVVLQG